MIHVILGFAILMAILYIVVEMNRDPLTAMMAKALASLSFIMLGVFAFSENSGVLHPMVPWVLIGLTSGLIGDLVLALRPLRPLVEDKKIIVFGIIFFSLGHFSYLLGLSEIPFMELSWLSFLIGIIVSGVVIYMSYLLKFEMGKARIPAYVYAFLIFTMIGQSVIFYLSNTEQMFFLLFMIGALLFGLSDLILAPIYFQKQNKKLLIALNLMTYYGAQILIAYSLFFL
jgi:hypothetical protein